LIPVIAVRDVVHFPGIVNTLHVVRDASRNALREAGARDDLVFVVSQRDMALEEPEPADLHCVGTLSETLQSIPMPDGSVRLALRGLQRGRAARLVLEGGTFWAELVAVEETPSFGPETEASMREAIQLYTGIVEGNPDVPAESLQGLPQIESAGILTDLIAHHLPIRIQEKQNLLEEPSHRARLESVLRILHRERQILDLKRQIHERVETEIGQTHRDFYLREQLEVIQSELRERENRVGEVEDYLRKLEESQLPPEAAERAQLEIRRLDRTPVASPEGMVLRNYLDTLLALPWSRQTADRLDVGEAATLLEERHHGLHRVKDRILDYLAVRQLRGMLQGPILCFQGPPGVGKTSIGRSIADAMDRKYVRLALGGVRDEAEIRGHRRTYVGSMPGRILQGLIDCGYRNPVILLDEIDKMGAGPQGDPTSALLEALDPEQNARFSDHYIETPFDLGSVLFVATANLLDNVAPALRDRMEVIPFPSYTDAERTAIARHFLFPRAREEHGLRDDQITLPDDSLGRLVDEFTREAGVRDLGRQIATLCRKSARQIAEGKAESVELDSDRLRTFLGQPKYRRTAGSREPEVGCAWAMVVSEAGGDLMTVEVALTETLGERPELLLTGNLGQVMRESAQAALTAVRLIGEADRLRRDAHIHVPEAAIPKDGPSAGLTIAVGLASALWGRPVRGDIAMTGEITLRGQVLPVGGVSEKVLAAARAGLREVLLPAENEPDLDEVPTEARQNLRISFVRSLSEAIALALV
jgi:ATP-dependent Lon protease